MRSFDDLSPEQIEERHEAMVELLRDSYRAPEIITPAEEASIIARVRTRLRESADASQQQDKDVQLPHGAQIVPLSPPLRLPATLQRRRRSLTLVSTLVALLLVGIAIGSFALVFVGPHPQLVSNPGVPAMQVSAHSEINGLDIAMHLSPGPYFLSELVAFDASITNHTHTTYNVDGAPKATICSRSVVFAVMTGGGAPHYQNPVSVTFSCPLGEMSVRPGQTITIHDSIILADSGTITVQAQVFFVTRSDSDPQASQAAIKAFTDHWPSVHIYVNPSIPKDHILTLTRKGDQVLIHAPAAARPLLYAYVMYCSSSEGLQAIVGLNPSYSFWHSLKDTVLHKPNVIACANEREHWAYIVSAVGYATASGSADFP